MDDLSVLCEIFGRCRSPSLSGRPVWHGAALAIADFFDGVLVLVSVPAARTKVIHCTDCCLEFSAMAGAPCARPCLRGSALATPSESLMLGDRALGRSSDLLQCCGTFCSRRCAAVEVDGITSAQFREPRLQIQDKPLKSKVYNAFEADIH